MKSGGFTISQLSVLPDEKKNFSLKVEVPVKVNKGTYNFTVSADGMAKLSLTITVSKQGTYQTDFTTTQPNMEGNSNNIYIQRNDQEPYSGAATLCFDSRCTAGMECGIQTELQAGNICTGRT